MVRTLIGASTSLIFSINVHRVGGGINFEAMDRAVYTLSPNAFAVYMFMVQHSTKIVWNFRLRTIEEKTNMSSDAISIALLELLATGYLTPIVPNDGSDTLKAFELWETPDLNTNAVA